MGSVDVMRGRREPPHLQRARMADQLYHSLDRLQTDPGRASPVHVKKKFRRLSEGNRSTLSSWSGDTDSLASSTLSRPILRCKYTPRMSTSAAPKHVQFLSDVTVFQVGQDGQHMCTKCEQLNYEPKPRVRTNSKRSHTHENVAAHVVPSRDVVDATQTGSLPGGAAVVTHAVLDKPGRGKVGVGATVSSSSGGRPGQYTLNVSTSAPAVEDRKGLISDNSYHSLSRTVTRPVQNNNIINNNSSTQKSAGPNSVNISFAQDPTHGTKLKFVVNIGPGFDPEDIVVKANMSGSRIRVMASKMVTRTDGSHDVQQFNERFVLPMDIDPFTVDARLDTKGLLTVEAPLITLEKRQNLGKDDHKADKPQQQNSNLTSTLV